MNLHTNSVSARSSWCGHVLLLVLFTSFCRPAFSEGAYEKRWFIFGGLMNYHSRMEESERQIDKQINGGLGRLICGWEEPETFKDWSDDWLVWDGYLGFGRDISPRWDWCVDFGGGMGKIENRETYRPLGLKLKSAIDFARTEAYAEGSLDFYPWGKPVLAARGQTGSGLMNALRSTRPYVSLTSGYSHQTAEVDVGLSVPVFGRVIRQTQEDAYDLFYVFPRISAEVAVGAKDFLNLTFGYVFFSEHKEEFDSFCTGIFWKHRF